MARWPTVEALAGAALVDVLGQWQGLGYPRRARDLHRSARLVVAGGWPDGLTTLPGIGPYVAAAIRCFALEEPVLPGDVNVERVLGRRCPDGVDITADPWRAGRRSWSSGNGSAGRVRYRHCPVGEGCGGPGDVPGRGTRRRRSPYEGSARQRRDRLLARVVAGDEVVVAGTDREIAASLAADGLAVLVGNRLTAPE